MEYVFESSKYEQLVEHANKVNKKLNDEFIVIKEISHEYSGVEEIVKYVKFDIDFNTTVNDWKILAKKSLIDGMVMVDTFTNDHISLDLREHDFHCDHCNTSRAKKNLYLIHNEKTNEYKYVGKACMKEFIGASVTKFFTEEKEIKRFQDLDDMLFDSYPTVYVLIKHYLSIAYDLAKSGEEYINRNLANYENIKSTSDKVKEIAQNEEIKENPEVNDIIKWFIESNKNSDNDFILNVLTLLKEDYIPEKLISRIIFIPFNYKKYLDKLELKRQRDALNAQMSDDYLPYQVGERVSLNLKLLKQSYYEREAYSYYDSGVTYVYTFIDEVGRVVIWKTGNSKYMQEEFLNKTFRVTGTIKEFNEYNNRKQTILTRCKIK